MARFYMDPYVANATPISDSVSKLGMAILANRKSPDELEYLRARTDHARTETDKIKRENTSRDEVAGIAGDQNFDPAKVAAARAAWIRGGDIKDLGTLMRVLAYTQNGAPVDVRDRAFMSAGGSAQSTETGHKKTLDNAIQQTGMQVAGANARNERSLQVQKEIEEGKDNRSLVPVLDETGALVMRPKSEVGKSGFVGTPVLPSNLYSPQVQGGGFVLSPNQPGMPVAAPGDKAKPDNYLLPDGKTVVLSTDGRTDMQGNAIPQGAQRFAVTKPDAQGAGEGKALRDTQSGQEKLQSNIEMLRDRITKNPASLGAVGTLRRTLQDAIQQGDAAATAFGVDVSAIRQAASRADASLAKNFDPSLPQIDLLANVIAYQAASVFAGQQGRDVSNADFARFRSMLGDDAILGNAPKMGANLDVFEQMLARDMGIVNKRLGQPAPAAPAGSPAPTSGGVPSAGDIDAELKRRGLLK